MYKLLDAHEQHRQSPETFEIPPKDEIKALKVGDNVKLCFEEPGKPGERMWVEIAVIEEHVFFGHLRNDPFNLETIKYNDRVRFDERHIYNTK